jgi:hypothetical protein
LGADRDELTKEIAGKHGVAVGRDDPIMILQTVNARLLEDSAKAQQEMLERYKEELEALSARWSSDARVGYPRDLCRRCTDETAHRDSYPYSPRARSWRCKRLLPEHSGPLKLHGSKVAYQRCGNPL